MRYIQYMGDNFTKSADSENLEEEEEGDSSWNELFSYFITNYFRITSKRVIHFECLFIVSQV